MKTSSFGLMGTANVYEAIILTSTLLSHLRRSLHLIFLTSVSISNRHYYLPVLQLMDLDVLHNLSKATQQWAAEPDPNPQFLPKAHTHFSKLEDFISRPCVPHRGAPFLLCCSPSSLLLSYPSFLPPPSKAFKLILLDVFSFLSQPQPGT